MVIQCGLILSVLLQFGAFFNTLRLIRRTKFNISWITISIALFLMAVRRLSELAFFVEETTPPATDYFNSWMAVLISLLMFVASFYIKRIFDLQKKIDRMRKKNEARVLSAIIETEEKERHLFACELHDGLGPILSSVKMAFSAIESSSIGEKNKTIIEKTESSIDNAITTVREISNNLSPHLLQKFGLPKALRTFYESIPKPDKPDFELITNPEDIKIPYNIKVILYRILNELINNTLKHAEASKIELSVFFRENLLELFYSDNGKGFDFSGIKQNNRGLSNIHSRVKSLGGKIKMNSHPGKGFFLKITIQL